MHRLFLAAALTLGPLGLAGCTGWSPADKQEAFKAGLEHIEACDRSYQGGTGMGAAFTFSITCKAQAPVAPAERATP